MYDKKCTNAINLLYNTHRISYQVMNISVNYLTVYI